MPKISIDYTKPVVNDIIRCKKEMAWHAINGNCRQFKTAAKAYSKLAVDNFELAVNVPGMEIKGKMPLKVMFNMLKIMVFNFFRKKSPEEKQFKQMIKDYRTKNMINLKQ